MNEEISNQKGTVSPTTFLDRSFSNRAVIKEFRKTRSRKSAASDFLQSVIDASASCIAILDQTRTILYVNRAWRQFAAQTGLLGEEYGVGSRYPDLCRGIIDTSPEDARKIGEGLSEIIENNEIEFQTEFRCLAVAEPLWFSMHAAAFQLPDQDGELALLVSHNNVTSARAESEILRKDDERLRILLATTNILPWEADAESWAFTYIGEQAVDMLGYSTEEWFDPEFWTSHIHPDDRERAVAECLRLMQSFDHYKLEYRMITKDEQIIWIEDLVSVVRKNSKPVTIRGFMIDITEQKQIEDTLRQMSGRLITAQEEERKRIARELHDDLNQRIALMSIELEQIGQMLPIKTDALAERVKGLQKKAEAMSGEIHRMSYQLHPSKLDHLGLAAALNSFCREFAESRGLKVDFRDEGIPLAIHKDVKLCVFRIAQEALQNAAKHSGASSVEVVVKKTDTAVELIVSDTGCGFDTRSGKLTKGLGFTSMQERLRLVDGKIRINSNISNGTRIEVTVPL